MADWDVVSQAPAAKTPPPPPAANPWAVVSHAPSSEAANRADDDPTHQEFWSSINHTLIKPAVDSLKDVAARGGPAVMSDMFDGIMDQLGEFVKSASAPGGIDVRKLPVIGTGAVSTSDRMNKQIAAGNYRGAAGSLIGFLAPFIAPEAIKGTPEAVGAAGEAASNVISKVKAAIPEKLPTVPGAIPDAIGVIPHPAAAAVASGIRLANRVAKGVNAVRAIGDDAPAAPPPAAPAVAPTAPPAAPVVPEAPLIPVPPGYAARPDAIPSEYGVLPALDRSQFFRPLAGDVAPPAPAAPAPAAPAPAPAAPVEPPAPAPGPVTPAEPPPAALTPAQRLEDAADEQAARLHMQAQDIEWANRAHKADRFAAYLLKNKLDPTHENLTAAAKALAEREVPSADTVDMIHDRMGYDPPQAAQTAAAETPATPAPAGPDLEQQLRDSIAAAQAKKGIPPEAAGAPPPGTLAQISPNSIKADPVRFQFKRDTGGAAGVGDKLKSVDTYNPDLGGILNVWHDPADGQTYVVNGHHRLDLAQRANAPSVDVRYIDAANAPEARAKGALINIAEDQGTPLDAAKLFRDTGISPADLKSRGISLSGKTARAGLGLSKLDQGIFDQVVSGDIPEANASIIGEMLPDRFADQRAVINAIDKAAARGKAMTPAQIQESIRVGMRPENQITETQDTLFGTESETRSLFAETGEISDYVRKQLSQEKRLFGSVSSSGAAERLGGAGNVINAEENSRIAGETKQAQAVYDKLSGMSGPVSDALAAGAKELATSGENPNAIKARTYESVRRAISETLSGAKGRVPEGLPPGDSDGVGQAPGPAPGDLFAPEVKPPAKRVRKIGDLGKLGDR